MIHLVVVEAKWSSLSFYHVVGTEDKGPVKSCGSLSFLFLSAKPIDSSHTKVTRGFPLSCGPLRTPDPLHVMPRSGLLKQLYGAPGTDCVCGSKVT